MEKKLEEMSRRELWKRFPIQLTAHRDEWSDWYAEEAARLYTILDSAEVARVSHIGSTAVEGIWAKPVVDILTELTPGSDMAAAADTLAQNGYRCMSRAENRATLCRGYGETGCAERLFHLHLRFSGDNDELYFRDLLRENPELAKEYESLKLTLWKQYECDRDAYTGAKTAFIDRFTELAKRRYGGRYEG